MHSKSAVMMRVLLNKYYKGSPESFLGCLPEEEIKAVVNIDSSATDPALVLRSPLEKINSIHYSWFVPYIEKLPEDVKPVMIAAFPKGHARMLSQRLKVREHPSELLPPVQGFLAEKLYKKLTSGSEPLPKEFLPQTSLSTLGTMNKDELVELVEFLGLHDLADELRHVVVQKTLKMVYACLNHNEQQYLKFCMQQKERVAAQGLGLDRWSGDCEKLKMTLQSRGIMRLGKALAGENSDFLWHLVHTFDSGRGQALMKYHSEKAIPGITPALAQQVLSLLNIFKRKSEA